MYLHYLYIILPDRRTRVRVTHVHFRLLFKGSLYRYEIDLRPPITRLPKFKRKKHIYLFLNKKKKRGKKCSTSSEQNVFILFFIHTYVLYFCRNKFPDHSREYFFYHFFFNFFFFRQIFHTIIETNIEIRSESSCGRRAMTHVLVSGYFRYAFW